MGYNIGPKIGIDGEREFRKQLSQINNAYKTLTAETKAATAAFDANGDEQGKLKKTAEQLHKQIDLQKQKVSLLSDMVQKATVKFGENSDEVTRLKGVMYDAQASLSGLEGELQDVRHKLNENSEAVENFGNEVDATQEKIADFGDILAANFLSDALYDGLQELSGKLKDIASDSIQAASDVAAETAQFEQTFGDLKDTANGALKSISDTTHIAVTRLQGSYTKLYAFARTVGVEQEQAMDISSRALIAAADSAAYYDRSIDEALESLQAFLKGNYANDAALGIAATETTRNTMANKLYAKSFKELTEAQKVETLLSMVEAGNAASGALGQAAREADNWNNVTGELTESWRQLLAKAGAPVLKKITPVVQDITKSLYKISEDINWDKFGDTVSAIIDFVLKNLPKLVKHLSAVGAGFAAMKLTTVIVSIAKTAAALVNAAKAAATTSAAIKAMGAALNVTPWGLAASAIGIVAGIITEVALGTKQTESELSKAMDSFTESMEQAEQSYQSTVTETEGAAFAAQHYVERLKELQVEGLNTAAAQQEYTGCVEQLNTLIPELNLSINEQTGLLEQDTAAVEENVEAWKQSAVEKALFAKNTEILEAYGSAVADLKMAEAELADETKRNERLHKEYKKTQESVEKQTAALAEIERKRAYEIAFTTEEYDKLTKESVSLSNGLTVLKQNMAMLYDECIASDYKIEDLGIDIANATTTVNSFAPQISLVENALASLRAETELASQAQNNQSSAADELFASLEALKTAYDEAYTEAEESLSSQIGLWEELDTESDHTAKSIVENWKKQKQAFENYDKNLRAAVDKKLDMQIIQDLSDGSLESMIILDKLVNSTDYTVEQINAEFNDNLNIRGALAETMAGVKLLDMPEGKQLIKDHGQLSSDCVSVMAEIGKKGAAIAGRDTILGAVIGIQQNKHLLIQAMSATGNESMSALRESLNEHSPSKESEEIYKYVIDGGVIGVEKNAAKLERRMRQLGDSSAAALLSEKLLNVSDHIASISMPSTNQNTSIDRRNYGGFYFTINQLPGESAEDLADRVMEKIQTAVDQKGAVFNA